MVTIYEFTNEEGKALETFGIGKRRLDLEAKTQSVPAVDLSFVTDNSLFKEFIKYLDSTFPEHKEILSGRLSFSDGVMKGSNDYIVPTMSMFLKKVGSEYQIARQRKLETNLPMLKGYYIDSGLALRNLGGTNKEQAKNIFEQLKSRGVKVRDFPLWIDLPTLKLDDELNYILTDETQYETAKCLNWESGTNYSTINDFGLPERKDKNSNRQIWNSDDSLSGCYLLRNSDLYCGGGSLAGSVDSGRVVLAKARSA